jgi:hypothetical protein
MTNGHFIVDTTDADDNRFEARGFTLEVALIRLARDVEVNGVSFTLEKIGVRYEGPVETVVPNQAPTSDDSEEEPDLTADGRFVLKGTATGRLTQRNPQPTPTSEVLRAWETLPEDVAAITELTVEERRRLGDVEYDG